MKGKKVFLEKLRSDKSVAFMFLIPGIILFLVVSVYPLLYSLYISFVHWNPLDPNGLKTFAGLSNYINSLKNKDFLNAFLLALKYTVFSLSIELVLGTGIALLVTNERINRVILNIFRGFLLIPMTIAPIVTGILWKTIYNVNYGPLNFILSFFHIPKIEWISNPNNSFTAVIVVEVWQWTMVVAFILVGGILALPKEPFEAATIDGASPIGSFFYITLPLLKPVYAVVILLRTMDLFKAFDVIYVMTYGGPGRSTEVLNLFIYKQGMKFLDLTGASASSWILLVILLPISLYLLLKILVSPER